MWKNEATEVWSFVAGTGLISEIEQVVGEELQMVPDYEPARLLRYHPEIQGTSPIASAISTWTRTTPESFAGSASASWI